MQDEEAECKAGNFIHRRNFDVPDIMDGMFSADTGIFYGSMSGGCRARGIGCGHVFGDCVVCADYGGSEISVGDVDHLDNDPIV